LHEFVPTTSDIDSIKFKISKSGTYHAGFNFILCKGTHASNTWTEPGVYCQGTDATLRGWEWGQVSSSGDIVSLTLDGGTVFEGGSTPTVLVPYDKYYFMIYGANNLTLSIAYKAGDSYVDNQMYYKSYFYSTTAPDPVSGDIYIGFYSNGTAISEFDPSITITSPSPYQSHEPIIFDTLLQNISITGTCRYRPNSKVMITNRNQSIIPVASNFTSPDSDMWVSNCLSDDTWAITYYIKDGQNNITAFSNEFLNESRAYVFGYDSAFVSFPVQQVMSFDPDQLLPIDQPFSDSQYTCATLPDFFEITGEAPFFHINEFRKHIQCLFIDENFSSNVDRLRHNQEIIFTNKIPTAYYYKVSDLWDTRATTTWHTITLDLQHDDHIASSSPLKSINYQFLDVYDLEYDNLPEGLKPVADFMEDRLVPVIFAFFIIWGAFRIAGAIIA